VAEKITLQKRLNKIEDFYGLDEGAKRLICQDPVAPHS
jgi:hypothetical protein